MAHWKQILTRTVAGAEERFDRLKYRLRDALGGPGPITIVPYRGYGNRRHLHLRGRVLEDKGDLTSSDNDSIWRNLRNTYRRAESDEVPQARLRACFDGQAQEVQADEEGIFDVHIETRAPLPEDRMWFSIELELLSPRSRRQPGAVRATGDVLVPPPGARFMVVSDIDDTVIDMGMGHPLRFARTIFLGNARSRVVFPGVAAFYRALHHGADGQSRNPLFYVSSAPWNLYDLLVEFFRMRDIPAGPVLFLRDWGITRDQILPTRHREHKLSTIRRMLAFYPDLPLLLIGDSGQEDAEIYGEIVAEHPGRVMAVYIRNVSRDEDRLAAVRAVAARAIEAGSPMILAGNTTVMAEHAAEQGWISPDSLAEIRGE